MTTDTPVDLDAIEKRVNAAEDGPWEVAEYPHENDNPDGWPDIVIRSTTGKRREVAAVIEDDVASASECPRENADFIAHARTDVPALIAEINRLRAEWDRLVNERAAMLGVVRAAQAWANAHSDRDIHRIRRPGAAPAVADLYNAVQQYRLNAQLPA